MNEVQYCDKLFYKYRPINSNTDRLLKCKELYFSHPDEYNDQFDCKVDSFHKGTHDEWVDFFCRRNMHPEASRNLIKARLKEGFLKQKKDGILYEGKESFDDGNRLRASCFSEKRDSPLMWGHYADNHRGICLSFKSILTGDHYVLPLATEYALPFWKVTYTEIKPKPVNLLNGDTKEIERIIYDFYLTKFCDWYYENEYRLLATIDDREEKSTINFQKDALEGIIFGLKVKPKDAQHIKAIVDEYYNGIDVKLYRTEKIKGKYAIRVIEIKNFDKYLKLLEQDNSEVIDYDSDKAFIDYIAKYVAKHPQNKLAKQVLSELAQDHFIDSDSQKLRNEGNLISSISLTDNRAIPK